MPGPAPESEAECAGPQLVRGEGRGEGKAGARVRGQSRCEAGTAVGFMEELSSGSEADGFRIVLIRSDWQRSGRCE